MAGKSDIVKGALDFTAKLLSGEGDEAAKAGIRAYHGSPHSFDKFSMDKVGTGVGAPDAFSKGLYFSEAEKNAEHFKRLGASPMIGGKKGRAAGLSPDAYESVWRFAHDEGKSGTLADVAAAAEADLLARSKELPFSARRDYQRVIDELNARGGEDVQLGANMYEVNINADPSTFADWDAPISQQSDAVKIALADFPPEKTWGQVYDTGKIREAEMLKRGVSGTKFKANDGTPNYVVFDDKLISIVKKYGIAGASAMLGYNLMEQLDPKQALAATMADEEYRVGKAGGGEVREGYSGRGRVIGDVVDQALKLVMGEGEKATKTGIKAYHVSPHDFDKFEWSPRTSKTGEGNQSYGAGLYFAENPSVSGRGGDYWRQFFNKMKSGPERTAAGAMFANKFELEKAINALESGSKYHVDRAIPGRYGDGPEIELGHKLLADETQQALELLRGGQIAGPRTYEVDINADPNQLLDWDKPLHEQSGLIDRLSRSRSPNVQRVLSNPKLMSPYRESYGVDIGPMTGENLFKGIALNQTGIPTGTPKTSSLFLQAEIPGIKYLDAGSRDAGDGTRNYVIFDDKRVDIKDKYADGGEVREGYAGKGRVVGDVVEQALKMVMGDSDEALRRYMQRSFVKDNEGNPIRLYHATPKSFDAFNVDPEGNSGPAIFLSPYANQQPAAHNVGGGEGVFREGTNVMPVYARVNSPLVIDTPDMLDWARSVYGSEFPHFVNKDARESLIKEGYDGVVFGGYKPKEYAEGVDVGQQPHGNEEVVVLHPNQVKSAISNEGTYDPNDPRIDKDVGGEVDPYADEVASAKALMAEKQYDEQSWGDWAGDAVGNALNTAKTILPTALGGEGSVGISDMARGAYEGAKDAVTFPGDVISGKQPLYDESGRPLESAVGRSFNTAATLAGASSVVPRPSNSLGVFGGIRSRTADKNALIKAQIMESQGGYYDPNGSFTLTGGNARDDIWRQTGWGRGAEGGLRYEIPDVGTTVDPAKFQLDLSTATIPSGMKTTLSEYINHPELFDAYPEFKNMVVKGYYEDSGINGYYMPRLYRGTINPGFSDPYIALNLKNLTTVEAQRATLLHEIQHAIQQKEGFVPGTSQRSRPLETPNPRYATYMNALNNDPEMKDLQSLFASDEYKAESAAKSLLFADYKKIVAELDAKQATTGVSTHNEYIDATNDFFSKTDGKFPLSKKAAQIGFSLEDRGIPSAEPPEFLDQFGAYWADAGEVEARNVQNRSYGPREELKERAPWRTQDKNLPYEAQLIDWNDTSWRKGYAGRGRVIGDVVDQALKLVMGSGDDAAKRISNIQKSDPFPVDYIEPGSLRYKYEHPDTSSFMEIITRPKGARSASVIGLEVPEEYRGTGIGKALQERVLQDFPSLMGQVSSKAAAVNAYKAGRRPLSNPNATIEDVFKMIDEDSSVNLATPKNTGGSVREGYAGRGFVNDKNVEAALKYLRREFGNLPSAPVDEAFRLEGRKLIDKSRNFESGVPILGNERFGTPMSEMQAEYDQVRNLKDYLSKRPHDLVKENAVIYPAIGDLSAAGKRLTKVGDKPLVTPTDLHGGFEFSRDVFGSGDNPASWAGRQGAAKTMADRLSSRTNEGEVPYLSSYTMGPQAVDSTHMVANTIINMMPNAKVAAADIARFNAEMKRDYPGWPGIMKTQKALEFMNARNRPGTHLSDFAKKLDKKEYRASGFPDVGEIRFAVSEPRLLGVPAGSTGFSMMKVKPTAETSTEGIQHGTYTNKIQSPEGYSGGFENVTPSRIMFPEWFDKLHPNAKIESQKAYQSAMTQFPKQKATNEWADNIEKYWAENPTPWGYAEGGSVEDEDSWFDSAMTIARNAADKATFGASKYAAAGADYLTDTALDVAGYENDADFDRALAEQEYAMKEGEEKNPAAAGAGDVLGYVAPYLAIGPAEGALSTLGYLSDYGSKIGRTGSLFARALGYADGGEVDDDIYHAVRLARDVGGATNENPQVIMTDANGVQYDATGKVIQTATPQANSNSSAAPSPTTPEEVGRRAAEDPATFDAMMERYAVPDRDIVDYEALKKEVSQQPQQVQQMTHVGAPPMRDIKVDMPLFGGEYNVGQAPYDIANPMSGVAQTAYDWKTTPLYFTPWTAPIGAGLDVAEGVVTGDPLTASLAMAFGPGGKMAKAAGIGAANYFIDPSDAEAGKASIVEGALKKIFGSGDEAVKSGIRAYHGGPHDFPPVRLIEMPDGTRLYQNMLENTDTPEGAKILQEYPLGRFDMSKIGTGEGAQAYGHGLYFAENEGVAKSYRDDLLSGTVLNVRPQTSAEEEVLSRIKNYSDEYGGVPEEATVYKDILNDYERAGEWIPAYKDMLNRAGGGSMYEVNIDADPNTFLDWDKPLSNQPEAVRKFFPSVEEAKLLDAQMDKLSGDVLANPDDKALQAAWDVAYKNPKYRMARIVLNEANPKLGGKFASGNQVYAAIAQNPSEASSLLKEAGIPGIKFLDAGSRSVGDGTRNYVVFDDRLISIIRKYGIAGASAMLGYNLMENLDSKQALAASMADEDYQQSSGSRMQGGRVTGGNPYGNDDPAVSRAIALTREY